MTDAICIWDPVFRLQFIGLGRGGGKRKVIMLEGKHCIACACVCVFPYLCLAKGNLIIPVFGFGAFWPLRSGLQCSVACRVHICCPVQGPQGIYIPSCGCLGPPDPARLF